MLLWCFTFTLLCSKHYYFNVHRNSTEILVKFYHNFLQICHFPVCSRDFNILSQFSWVTFLISSISCIQGETTTPVYIFSPLSALHSIQHLSHSPFLRAFILQPLVVTVISLLPSNQVMDWPPLSKKSAVGSLQIHKGNLVPMFMSVERCILTECVIL